MWSWSTKCQGMSLDTPLEKLVSIKPCSEVKLDKITSIIDLKDQTAHISTAWTPNKARSRSIYSKSRYANPKHPFHLFILEQLSSLIFISYTSVTHRSQDQSTFQQLLNITQQSSYPNSQTRPTVFQQSNQALGQWQTSLAKMKSVTELSCAARCGSCVNLGHDYWYAYAREVRAYTPSWPGVEDPFVDFEEKRDVGEEQGLKIAVLANFMNLDDWYYLMVIRTLEVHLPAFGF